MNWNWKKMISIVLVVTVCTTGSAIAQAVECDVPQYTFSDENIEIVDPALFYDLFTQENDINAIQDDTLDIHLLLGRIMLTKAMFLWIL